jgi:hypothetical protein
MFNHFLRILSVAVALATYSGTAKAITFDLTLTPTPGSTLSGTGVLTLSFTGSLDNAQFGPNTNPGVTALTFSIDGFNFNFDGSPKDFSAVTFSPTGKLLDITALGTAIGNPAVSLTIVGLQATFFENGLAQVSSTDTITATTPLPAALPIFAAGLGVTGLFGWRRRRKEAPITI